MLLYLHIVLEDVSCGAHIYNVKDDELAEGGQQIPPLVQSFDLVGLVLLVALCWSTSKCSIVNCVIIKARA